MLYVIAYDISDDRRRTKVAKEMENWGVRIQYSLFECDLDSTRVAQLTERLYELTIDEDQIRVYRLCQSCFDASVAVRGKQELTVDPDFYQV